MAEVFLSYAREDKARADQVAQGLIAAGIQVFWDSEIPPGQTWADYIETKLTQCKALIVLWSATSTKSQWVREEARMGRDKGVLIPAMIDGSVAPFGFGEVQAANLSTWNGEPDHPDWRRFLDAVRAAANRTEAPLAAKPMPNAPPRAAAQAAMSAPASAARAKGGLPTWAWVLGGVGVAVAGLIVIAAMVAGTTTPQQTAAVAPVMSTPSAETQPVQPQPLNVQQYQEQVLQRLAMIEQAVASEGFHRVAEPVSGQLPQGQSQDWPVTLNVGAEFRVMGACDSDCGDLDLTLMDGYGAVISQDTSVDANPIVSVIPTTSGQFMVRAHMYNCSVAPCYYALVLYGRSQ